MLPFEHQYNIKNEELNKAFEKAIKWYRSDPVINAWKLPNITSESLKALSPEVVEPLTQAELNDEENTL